MGKKALRREVRELRQLIEITVRVFERQRMPQSADALSEAYYKIEKAE